jgi:hypothetical protein
MPGLEDTLEGVGEFGFKRVVLGVDVEEGDHWLEG